MAYKLQLPESSQIHPVFHVSQLKAFTPDHTPVFSDLPEVPMMDTSIVEHEAILDRRLTKKGNAAVVQVLIKWISLPSTMATWEDYNVLKSSFPSAAAWGQAGTQGGHSVTADSSDQAGRSDLAGTGVQGEAQPGP